MIGKKKQRTSNRCRISGLCIFVVAVFFWIILLCLSLHVFSQQEQRHGSTDTSPLFDAVQENTDNCDMEFQRLTEDHRHNLTLEDFRRSRAWVGNEKRLAKFIEKLSAKTHPVAAIVYGGSISMGHGLEDGSLKYLNEFEKWMNSYFPLQSAKHKVYSRAGHGADMCYVAKRMMTMINDIPPGQQIDMIILETAVNDYQGQDHKIHLDHKTDVFFDGFQQVALCVEAVVRRLLESYPDAAIVFLEFQTAILNRKTAQFLHLGVAQHYQIPLISYSETMFPGFYRLMNLLEPYDYSRAKNDTVAPFPHGCAPCLAKYINKSFRDKGCKSLCVFMKRSGRKCDDNPSPGREQCYLPYFAHDAVHPSMIGHQIAKDLIVNAIAQVGHLLCSGEIPADHVLPPTTWLGSPNQLYSMTNFVMVKDTMGVYSAQDPLISTNYSKGFKLYGDQFAERKGWISTNQQGGDYVVFDIDLEDGCYEIIISILKSYEGMGIVTIDLFEKHANSLINSVQEDGIWVPRISVPADVILTNSKESKTCSGKCAVVVKTHPIVAGRNRNKVKIVSLSAQTCAT